MSIEQQIEGSEKLVERFGYWPSFHDAEILEIHLWRGDVEEKRNRFVLPILTLRVHLWAMSDRVKPDGYLELQKHTVATLRFHGVDDLEMAGFNCQNAILSLSVELLSRPDHPSPKFLIELDPAFGISARFQASRVEVVEATDFAESAVVRSHMIEL